MTLSVIIATRDRAPLLQATLEALAAQEPTECTVEIVVVDNGSADDTPSVCDVAVRSAVHPMVYLREERPGKSTALNTAIGRARGDVLVLTDDDVLPSPGWLAAYERAFGPENVDFAVGRILPHWEAQPPRWLSPALYGVLAVPDGGVEELAIGRGVNEHIMPIGANMAVRRAVVDRIGGWNPNLGKLHGTLRTGEDHEFSLKMLASDCTGVYVPAAVVRHRVPADRLRLSYFRRWFFDNGGIEAGLEDEYPTTRHYLLGVPRHLWRQMAGDLLSALGATFTFNSKRLTAAVMRLTWFAGYVRGRCRTHAVKPRGTLPAALSRS